jgi:hypothetical protein
MDKVIITRPFTGICSMQVCAHKDATDEEILLVCNSQNPSGTTNGWSEVVRVEEDYKPAPIQCADHADRLHYVILC